MIGCQWRERERWLKKKKTIQSNKESLHKEKKKIKRQLVTVD